MKDLSDGTGNVFTIKFSGKLEIVETLNAANASHPTNDKSVYTVEDAFVLAVKEYNIQVPVSFLLSKSTEFVLYPPGDVAYEPVWPKSITSERKKVSEDLLHTTNRVHRGYTDMLCKVREDEDLRSSRLRRQDETSPELSNYRHAYVNKAGVLVDNNGAQLIGDDLKIASSRPLDQIPGYEDMYAWHERLRKDLGLIKGIEAEDKDVLLYWKEEYDSLTQCAIDNCDISSK
jgi:hypothetical protein